MATLEVNGKKKEVPDGERIKPAAEALGVPFGCDGGVCGVCVVEVIEGKENLSELTQHEKDMGLEPSQRLACQCRIKKGAVKLKY